MHIHHSSAHLHLTHSAFSLSTCFHFPPLYPSIIFTLVPLSIFHPPRFSSNWLVCLSPSPRSLSQSFSIVLFLSSSRVWMALAQGPGGWHNCPWSGLRLGSSFVVHCVLSGHVSRWGALTSVVLSFNHSTWRGFSAKAGKPLACRHNVLSASPTGAQF